ncbi:MAG: zinc-binding dehydrogenase [Myxococcales bacterium]|nr:zinc-binding dehydrogenase [Myxococcales bacterium]
MRSLYISKHGGPDVLDVRDAADPVPGPGEVRVRIEACGLNFAEVSARVGLYPDAPKPPCVLGYEAAGVVDQLGEGVDDLAIGTRVVCMKRFGAHADVLCTARALVVEIPDEMSFDDAAALPVNYLTAFHMLFVVANLRPKQTLLLHMAAGGVGVAVLQLARTVEDVTIFGTASGPKHDFIRDLGCNHPIDYRTADYGAEVMRLTGGKGVDLILDPLGGKDWKRNYKLLRPVGKLIVFGFANAVQGEKRNMLKVVHQLMSTPLFTPLSLMDSNRCVAGVNMGHLWDELELLSWELAKVIELYREGHVRPHVDATFPFSQAAEAHRYIQGRKNVGKVVLHPD